MDVRKPKNFGENLKFLRKQSGLTQQQLAEKLNTSRSCISNYESGARQPDNETIKMIADLFDVSVDYLFGRSEVKTLIKSNVIMKDVQDFSSQINSFNSLDLRGCSSYVKCAVAEFYAYLLRKERNKK